MSCQYLADLEIPYVHSAFEALFQGFKTHASPSDEQPLSKRASSMLGFIYVHRHLSCFLGLPLNILSQHAFRWHIWACFAGEAAS